ncbi:hypothetical protein D3OALGA1CA_135 [Olavius algarvensis associated proteobacterium Delta 3]|nr:hypothetical protein D3OALGA1CA_135 [Olavius algarvensis associated proteobacterium Delta 3]
MLGYMDAGVRCRVSDIRDQMSDVGRRRTEDRGQKAEDS